VSVDTDVQPDRRNRAPLILLVVAVVLGLALGVYWLVERAALEDRRAEVADRGADVMPFALEDTTHVFRPTEEGGVQSVVADDPDDDEQIALIREHLRDESERFARGDFSDPASIHGEQMPGLQTLSEGAGAIDITYVDQPGGGEVTYVTDDPELVDALHDWFDAQLSDHGHDAVHG